MARQYRVDFPTTWNEDRPLNAHLCTEMQNAAESFYEENRNDYCVILSTPDQGSSGWYHGPAPVLFRKDRDGLWRSMSIEPLCSGQGVAQVLVAAVTDSWREPEYDYSTGDGDPGTSWSVSSSSTNAWQTAKEITIPRGFTPRGFSTYDDEEECTSFVGWLHFWWGSISGNPEFCGYRVEELVDDSWL